MMSFVLRHQSIDLMMCVNNGSLEEKHAKVPSCDTMVFWIQLMVSVNAERIVSKLFQRE